jgi:hypothetical protein
MLIVFDQMDMNMGDRVELDKERVSEIWLSRCVIMQAKELGAQSSLQLLQPIQRQRRRCMGVLKQNLWR